MATAVMGCSCINDQQDKIHGRQQRVFNQTAKEDGKLYRCTSCSTTKNKSGTVVPQKKKK